MASTQNIQRIGVQCQCDQLFACASVQCIMTVPKTAINVNLCLVCLSTQNALEFGEEHDIGAEYTRFLIRGTDVQKLNMIRLPECTTIFCPNELTLEVFELIPDAGRPAFDKYDKFGICWHMTTTKCNELDISQWPILLQTSQEL